MSSLAADAASRSRRKADDEGEAAIAGKFEVYSDKAGKFRFRLKAANGEIVATGEAYETKAGARNGCEAVQRAADGAEIVETGA